MQEFLSFCFFGFHRLNSVIANNSATSYYGDESSGGGIYSKYSDWPLIIINSTIANNQSETTGGGIELDRNFELINNIFYGNKISGTVGEEIYLYSLSSGNLYYNYIDYTKLYGGNVIIKKNNIQPVVGNPDFIDADFRIGVNSVAIDKGLDPYSPTFTGLFTDLAVLASIQSALSTDKDGNQRIVGAAIDSGAYEYGASNPPIMGDMNNDGNIDISDVILVLRIALKIDPIQPCSDLNNDGVVDISDVILTLRMALKIDPLQQCS